MNIIINDSKDCTNINPTSLCNIFLEPQSKNRRMPEEYLRQLVLNLILKKLNECYEIDLQCGKKS